MCSRLFCFCASEASRTAAFRLDSSREKTGLENLRIFQTCKYKIIFLLNMVKA